MVKAGVVKGTGKEPMVDGQQKVANTALYVLMQRAIVPGCPLVAEGKSDQTHVDHLTEHPQLRFTVMSPIIAQPLTLTVANTALYVLMQRAIVPGCPLVAEGKSDQTHVDHLTEHPQLRFTVMSPIIAQPLTLTVANTALYVLMQRAIRLSPCCRG